MDDPALYCESGKKLAVFKDRLEELEQELSAGYKQWEELEAFQGKENFADFTSVYRRLIKTNAEYRLKLGYERFA